MSTKDLVRGLMQNKGDSAMVSALENANEVAARANNVGPKAKK